MRIIVAITRIETYNSLKKLFLSKSEDIDPSDVLPKMGIKPINLFNHNTDKKKEDIKKKYDKHGIDWDSEFDINSAISDAIINLNYADLTVCRIHKFVDIENNQTIILLCLDEICNNISFIDPTSKQLDFNKLEKTIKSLLNSCNINTSAPTDDEFILYIHDTEVGYNEPGCNKDTIVRYHGDTKEPSWQNKLPLFNSIFIFQHVTGKNRIYNSLLEGTEPDITFFETIKKISDIEKTKKYNSLIDKYNSLEESLTQLYNHSIK